MQDTSNACNKWERNRIKDIVTQLMQSSVETRPCHVSTVFGKNLSLSKCGCWVPYLMRAFGTIFLEGCRLEPLHCEVEKL